MSARTPTTMKTTNGGFEVGECEAIAILLQNADAGYVSTDTFSIQVNLPSLVRVQGVVIQPNLSTPVGITYTVAQIGTSNSYTISFTVGGSIAQNTLIPVIIYVGIAYNSTLAW